MKAIWREGGPDKNFGWGALPPRPPPLNGRSSHLIEAAKRGRLDQMIFFSAPLTIRARRRRPFKNGRKWLRSAWNLGKTRFRRFPTFHFSTPKNFFWAKFWMKIFAQKKIRRKIDKLPVFAELWIFGPNRQMRLEKLPPKFWFSTLYDFWRRGKWDSFNFCPRLSAKNDFNPFRFLARRHMCPAW